MKNKSILFCIVFLSACVSSSSIKDSLPIIIPTESVKYKEEAYARFPMPSFLDKKEWIWIGGERVPAYCSYHRPTTIEWYSFYSKKNSFSSVKEYADPYRTLSDFEKPMLCEESWKEFLSNQGKQTIGKRRYLF